MDKSRDEKTEELLREIKTLPEGMQKALIWAIKHWGLVKCLCKDPGLTSEEIEEMKKTSREKEDHLLLVLLFAAQEFCNGGEDLEQQDKCI